MNRSVDSGVGYANLMVRLIFIFKAAEYQNRVILRRLGNRYRLEAPFKSGILFDILAVFRYGRSAYQLKFTARQSRL